MVIGILVMVVVIVAGVAEWLHARRCRAAAYLAFGPRAQPRPWVAAAPWLRLAGAGLTAWGLGMLISLAPSFFDVQELAENQKRHLLLVLDVSPSMHLKDSGPGEKKQKRSQRAAAVVRSLMERLVMDQVRVSVIAVYSDARPVVKEAKDLNVIHNILDDLPLDQAFDHGKTNLFAGIDAAAELAEAWRESSATLVLISDGETLPDTTLRRLPRSIAGTLVAGVGNPRRGTLINGEQSRQDAATLRRLAGRLGGRYVDVNEKHLPTETIQSLDQALPVTGEEEAGLRELALAATTLGSLLMAGVPVALGLAGVAPLAPKRRRKISEPKQPSSATV